MKPEKQQGEGGVGKKGLGHWLRAPALALSRACDSYVRKMSAWEGAVPTQYAGARMQQESTFSSRSTRRGPNGGDEDVNELVRAMSQRQQRDVPAATVQARSRSVAVGRIDEDAPYEFGADAGSVGIPLANVGRSRSAAVAGGVGASAVSRKAAGGVVNGG